MAFSEYLLIKEERKSITTEEFKYIYFPDVEREELYDLKEDPSELTNLITINSKEVLQFKKQIKAILDNNQKISNILLQRYKRKTR